MRALSGLLQSAWVVMLAAFRIGPHHWTSTASLVRNSVVMGSHPVPLESYCMLDVRITYGSFFGELRVLVKLWLPGILGSRALFVLVLWKEAHLRVAWRLLTLVLFLLLGIRRLAWAW